MMPAPEPMESALPREGRLGDPAVLPRLYSWLARGEWSGMVVVKAGDAERRIYFVEGRVGTAGSSDPGESLAQHLIREGLLSEEERSRAAGQLRATDRGWAFGRQLVRAGMLQERDLARVERRRVIELVETTLSLRTGTYACEPGTVAGDAQPQQALEIPRLVAEGVLTYWDANSALEALGGRDALADLVVEHLAEHEATGAEEAYDYTLLLCNGKRTLAEVMALSPLPEAASLRFLAALRLLDVIATRPAPGPQQAEAPRPATAPSLIDPVVTGTTPAAVPGIAAAAGSGLARGAAAGTAPRAGESDIPAALHRDAAPGPPAADGSPKPAGPPRAEPPRAAPAAAAAPKAAAKSPDAAASSPQHRTLLVLVILAILLAATAFFGWIGWRELSAPEVPAPAAPPAALPEMPAPVAPPETQPGADPALPLPETSPGLAPGGAAAPDGGAPGLATPVPSDPAPVPAPAPGGAP